MNNLAVNGITDLANLVDKRRRKSTGAAEGSGMDVILPNRLLISVYSSLTAELVDTLAL